ncbi:glycosyltransferase [Aureimonas psammosilenae]|uniref:glycosyltransferase n=1 Tax=Aureimonas psammosilenae TaxID=2495496 RepID=UPI001869D68F|nr:glycosyltransferase [Aureimonas psammosilenae]
MHDGRPTILHLSIDFNDPHRASTTTAIEWFVAEHVKDFDTVVVSMTRQSDPRQTYLHDCGVMNGSRVFAFGYHGLPFGIALFPSMWLAARRIRKLLDQEGIRPDLIHAHKLGFEGISAWVLSRWYKIPFFVSLRGEVETKIFRRKPDYRPLLRRIVRDAKRVYHVSAWFRDEFHRHVPPMPHERLLPNIVRNIKPEIATVPAGNRFVTIMNLDIWRKKGLHTLLDGLALALRERPGIALDIVGSGKEESKAAASALVKKAGVEENVRFLGRLDNAALIERLPTYRGLLLPSSNETFGMVYVEALFAGIPVMHTKGTGIDGYLDNLDVSIGVPEGDAAAVAAAILRMDRETEAYRARLTASASELFTRFDKERMVANYRADVAEALTAK